MLPVHGAESLGPVEGQNAELYATRKVLLSVENDRVDVAFIWGRTDLYGQGRVEVVLVPEEVRDHLSLNALLIQFALKFEFGRGFRGPAVGLLHILDHPRSLTEGDDRHEVVEIAHACANRRNIG